MGRTLVSVSDETQKRLVKLKFLISYKTGKRTSIDTVINILLDKVEKLDPETFKI